MFIFEGLKEINMTKSTTKTANLRPVSDEIAQHEKAIETLMAKFDKMNFLLKKQKACEAHIQRLQDLGKESDPNTPREESITLYFSGSTRDSYPIENLSLVDEVKAFLLTKLAVKKAELESEFLQMATTPWVKEKLRSALSIESAEPHKAIQMECAKYRKFYFKVSICQN